MALPFTQVPGTPANTDTGQLTQYGVNLLGNAVGNAGALGGAASALYNPLLSQYLTGVNQNPLVNLYETGGTSNPLLIDYLNAAGINLSSLPQSPQAQVPGVPTAQGNRVNTAAGGRPTPANPAPLTRGFSLGGNPNAVQQAFNALNPATQGGRTNTPAQAQGGAAENQYNLTPGAPAQPNTVSIAANVMSPQNPYGLTQAQQTQLNGQIQQYQLQAQSSLAQYHEQMAQDGVDPAHAAEGAALIQQTYNSMSDQLAASFAEQARQAQLAALSNLMGAGQSAFTSGQGELAGILGGLQSQQNLGINTALSGGTAALNQANVQAQQAAANNANQNSLLGSIFGSLPIIGSFFGGGGGGGGSANVPVDAAASALIGGIL